MKRKFKLLEFSGLGLLVLASLVSTFLNIGVKDYPVLNVILSVALFIGLGLWIAGIVLAKRNGAV